MARVEGVAIPDNKKVLYSLTYVHGIGLTSSKKILAATGIFFVSITLLVSLTLTFISGSFFIEGFGKNTGWFLDVTSQVTRYPKSMYPAFMQILLLPIFYITSPAFDLLQHRFSIASFLYQVLTTVIVIYFCLFLWTKGLKEYSSSN